MGQDNFSFKLKFWFLLKMIKNEIFFQKSFLCNVFFRNLYKSAKNLVIFGFFLIKKWNLINKSQSKKKNKFIIKLCFIIFLLFLMIDKSELAELGHNDSTVTNHQSFLYFPLFFFSNST